MNLGKIGREDAHPLTADDQAAQRRVERARRCGAWSELDPADLVQRERGYLILADTDEAFLPYRGDAFSPSGEIVADVAPLRFYVDGDDVVLLEHGLRGSRSSTSTTARRGWHRTRSSCTRFLGSVV